MRSFISTFLPLFLCVLALAHAYNIEYIQIRQVNANSGGISTIGTSSPTLSVSSMMSTTGSSMMSSTTPSSISSTKSSSMMGAGASSASSASSASKASSSSSASSASSTSQAATSALAPNNSGAAPMDVGVWALVGAIAAALELLW